MTKLEVEKYADRQVVATWPVVVSVVSRRGHAQCPTFNSL